MIIVNDSMVLSGEELDAILTALGLRRVCE